MGKKKGKKKKKSKEEIEAERLRIEEEERLAAEAEAKRIAEEKAAAAEKERLRLEEEARLRREELSRLDEESTASAPRFAALRKELEDTLAARAEVADWARFTACAEEPNTTSDRELNTFMSTWAGEDEEAFMAGREAGDGDAVAVAASAQDLNLQVQDCELAQNVSTKLDLQMHAALDANDEVMAAKQVTFKHRILHLMIEKLDRTTAEFIRTAPSKGEGQSEVSIAVADSAARLNVGIWVNLASKGFRPRNVPFDDIGITVVLPKSLALHSLACRVIQICDDVCPEPKPRGKTPEDAAAAAARYGAGFDELPAAKRQSLVEEVTQARKWLRSMQKPTSMMVVGGIFLLELLGLPEAAKRVKNWGMRDIRQEPGSVKRLEYPLEGTPATQVVQPLKVSFTLPAHVMLPNIPAVGWWNPEKGESGDWDQEGITDVQFDRAKHTVSFTTIHTGKMGVISPHHEVAPYTEWSLAPVFENGETLSAAILSVDTAKASAQIRVDAEGCRLLKAAYGAGVAGVANADVLAQIVKAGPMLPRPLLARLAFAGLNFLWTNSDAQRTALKPREAAVEAALYKDMALLAKGVEFFRSKWNAELSAGKCAVLMREAKDTEDDAGEAGGDKKGAAATKTKPGEDGFSILVELDADSKRGVKVSLLAAQEDKDAFDAALGKGDVTHAHLFQALTEGKVSEEVMAGIDSTDACFIANVQSVLAAMRIATFG